MLYRIRFFLLYFILVVVCFPATAFAGLLLSVPVGSIDFGTVEYGIVNEFSASLGAFTVTDDRAGSPGWNLSASMSHMTLVHDAIRTNGSNGNVVSAGAYDGTFGMQLPQASYRITIKSGGAVGVATFDVSGIETMTDVVTGSFVAIGTKGVRADFDVGTYVVGDAWLIMVDTFSYTGSILTSGAVTVNQGSGTGVSAGGSGSFAGTGIVSNNLTIMGATAGNGTGSYSITPSLSVGFHEQPLAGIYNGEVIYTLS